MSATSTHSFEQRCSIAAIGWIRSLMSAGGSRRDVEIRKRDTTGLMSFKVLEIARFDHVSSGRAKVG